MGERCVVAIAMIAALNGCDAVTGLSDFGVVPGQGAGSGGTGGTGNGPGGGGAGGDGRRPTGGGPGSGGAGTGGGGGSALLDDGGLIARYYLDETATGLPALALDSSPTGADLTVYPDQSDVSYVETAPGQRGVRWPVSRGAGRLQLDDANVLVDALAGADGVTVELVLDITEAGTSCTRIFHLGDSTGDGELAACVDADPVRLDVRLYGANVIASDAETLLALVDRPRAVAHFVYDTTEAAPADRVRVYLDGQLFTNGNASDVPPTPLDLPSGDAFVLGNRPGGDRSLLGTIYYAAIYSVAFGSERATAHTAVLLDRDDTP